MAIADDDYIPDIDIKGTENYDYDQWLEFFRKTPASKVINSIDWLSENISGEGYAAAKRWLQIFDQPNRIDKLYKGQLDKQKEEDIMDIAIGDDDEAFYIALIRQNTAQLNNSSTSQQEVARLTANINIFRKELSLIRSRTIKKGTTLDRVLTAANTVKKPKKKPVKKPKAKGVANAKKTARKPKAKN